MSKVPGNEESDEEETIKDEQTEICSNQKRYRLRKESEQEKTVRISRVLNSRYQSS